MRRYFVLARSIAVGQSAQCLVRAHHAGVVQNEHRGPVDIAAAPVIRGGSYRRNKGGIRSEHRHAGTLSEIACPSEHWFGFVSFRLRWQGSVRESGSVSMRGARSRPAGTRMLGNYNAGTRPRAPLRGERATTRGPSWLRPAGHTSQTLP